MMTKLRNKAKSVVLLFTSSLVLGFGGTCIPDNFWANTWYGTVEATWDTVYTAYVLDPLIDSLLTLDDAVE